MANTGKTEINTRIVLKHDSEEKWSQSTLVPYQGEIIIYDADVNNPKSEVRFKIGDGMTAAKDLPFAILTPNEIEEIVSKITSYGVVREEGNAVSAKSLEGLSIGVISNINFVQTGEGDPSRDNERHIDGWKTVSLTRTGKNLMDGLAFARSIQNQVQDAILDETTKTISYLSTRVKGSVFPIAKFKPNTRYTFIIKANAANTARTMNMRVTYTTGIEDNNFNLVAGQYIVLYTDADKTVTGLAGYNNSGETILDYEDCGVFEGIITAEEFERYKGETLTADLPETIYGGELDWNTGVLTVNYHMITSPVVGTIRQTSTTPPINYATIKPPEEKKCVDATKVICNRYTTAESAESGRIRYINESFLIYDNGLTEANKATYFNDLQICYPIEPYTRQLTPQQLKAIEGYNSVWSDCGDTCAKFNCTYVAQPDATLTISGMAADAKVTGEKIEELRNSINQTPDVSGQINTHNESPDAHEDIRTDIGDLSELIGNKDNLPEGTASIIGAIKSVKDSIPSTENFATKDDVSEAIGNLVDSAPDKLNTLNELAAALNDNENFATTVIEEINKKVDKEEGKGLSTHDYDDEEKNRLANLNTLVGETSVSTQISTAISKITYPVTTVNEKTGDITLTAEDVGALPDTTKIPSIEGLAKASDVNDQINTVKELIVGKPEENEDKTLEDLNTEEKSSIVAAINEVNSKVGDMEQLSIEDVDSIVGAINNVKNSIPTVELIGNDEIDIICGAPYAGKAALIDEATGENYILVVNSGSLKMRRIE